VRGKGKDARCGMRDAGSQIEERDMSYRDLEIWQMSEALVLDVHKMTLSLPAPRP